MSWTFRSDKNGAEESWGWKPMKSRKENRKQDESYKTGIFNR